MTLQQYIESISRVFPSKGQTEITLDINNGLKDFAEKTKIKTGMWTFTISSGVVTGTNEASAALTIIQPVESSKFFSVAIPSNMISFSDIKVYGTDSAQMNSEVFYEVTETHLRVYNAVQVSSEGVFDATSFSTPERIELSVSVYPTALSALGDVPDIPAAYHRALESYVFSLYYRRQPMIAQGQQGGQYAVNINMAREFDAEYQSYVIRGKKHYFLNYQMGQTVADGWNY